ncbi:MAG: murein biosynthesis integral membrane protein MurJ [Kiritimatiellales bacterium]
MNKNRQSVIGNHKFSVLRSAGIVSGCTVFSRFLGLIRDILMAGAFGTSLVMSAFVVAFTVPNLFRRLFGEGALSAAFVPVLVETREKEGDAAAWKFVNRVLSLLFTVLTIMTLIIIVAVAFIPAASEKTGAVFSLLQIMMPYMIFICLAAVSMGILNSFHHFAVPAFAPGILNILWIGALIFCVPFFGKTPEEKIRFVAWAVLLAGVLQWAVQWPVLRRFGWSPEFTAQWNTPRIRRMLLLMGPAAVGMAVTQVNVMVDRLLALWIGQGAPAALFYSERLVYFPLGIIATALGTVLLPVFSKHAARADHSQILAGISDGLRHLLFIMTPAAAGLLIMAFPIVRMIFEWQAFDSASTWMTAAALICYAPGLVVFSLAKVFVPAFYALKDTKTPVRIGAGAVLLNLILNLIFIFTLPQNIKHAGIAAATVIAEAANIFCLAFILQRRIGAPDWRRIIATAWRSLTAAVLMSAVCILVYNLLPHGSKPAQIISVLLSIGAGAGMYFTVGILFRMEEIREFLRVFNKRNNS